MVSQCTLRSLPCNTVILQRPLLRFYKYLGIFPIINGFKNTKPILFMILKPEMIMKGISTNSSWFVEKKNQNKKKRK